MNAAHVEARALPLAEQVRHHARRVAVHEPLLGDAELLGHGERSIEAAHVRSVVRIRADGYGRAGGQGGLGELALAVRARRPARSWERRCGR